LQEEFAMLMTRERQPAFRTIEGWARNVLLEARAIRECEEHGWMVDRADDTFANLQPRDVLADLIDDPENSVPGTNGSGSLV
jgi:hypothetical protein